MARVLIVIHNKKLFFVVVGDSFSQADLDVYVVKKNKVLSQNAKIITIEGLKEILGYMEAYSNPLLK